LAASGQFEMATNTTRCGASVWPLLPPSRGRLTALGKRVVQDTNTIGCPFFSRRAVSASLVDLWFIRPLLNLPLEVQQSSLGATGME